MAQAGDLLIVHMLQPQAIGSYFDRRHWPLHITIMQWFTPQGPFAALRNELSMAAQRVAPFDVTVGEEKLFGTDANIPVHVLQDQTKVKALHALLLAVIRQFGLKVGEERWTDEGYNAHITHASESIRAHSGDNIHVASFYVVRLIDENTCQIVAECNLTGTSND